MVDKKRQVIGAITAALGEGPKSINEISHKAKINWRTAQEYLELLKDLGIVFEKKIKNTRTFFYKQKDSNMFGLYVKKKDKKIISTIYNKIRIFSKEFYDLEPTKTQAYKVLWKVSNKLNLNLPVGWYLYGPCCVQIYTNEEKEEVKLKPEQLNIIKETTKEYGKYGYLELQKIIYKEEKNDLYLLKEKILSNIDKKEADMFLMEMVKLVPKECVDVTTDLARTTLLAGWDRTRHFFGEFWKYIALVRFRDSLGSYYGNDVDFYLEDKIDSAKGEIRALISDMIHSHVSAKHSQDKLYRRWVKGKR